MNWKEDYLISYDVIDQQHEELINILKDIENALVLKDNQHITMVGLVGRLEEYVKSHFDYEEELMLKSDYPYITEHVKEHNEFRYRLRHTYVMDIEKPQEYYEEMSCYLTNWVVNHILHIDKVMVGYL